MKLRAAASQWKICSASGKMRYQPNRTIIGKFEELSFIAVGTNGYICTKIKNVYKVQQVGTSTWSEIAYGNGKYVVINGNGYSSVSNDGINWTIPKQVTNTRSSFKSIKFINGQFILVNYYGYLNFSSDGIVWTEKQLSISNEFYDIAFGNEKYVLVGDQGYLATLTNNFTIDSSQWIKDDLNDKWRSIGFGNGKFVVVGDGNGRTSSSTDGINWTPVKKGSGADVTYGNGKFISVGSKSASVSTDGINWKSVTIENGSNYTLESVTFNNGTFIAAGYEYISYGNFKGCIIISTNGENWSTLEPIKDKLNRVYDICIMP